MYDFYVYYVKLKTFLLIQFQCCGIDSPDDWKLTEGIPMSCCTIDEGLKQIFHKVINLKILFFSLSGAIGQFNCTNQNAFKTGCLVMLSTYVKSHAVSLGAAGVTLALIQVNGLTTNRRTNCSTQIKRNILNHFLRGRG